MLAKHVTPSDILTQETPQQQMENHPVIRTLYDHTNVCIPHRLSAFVFSKLWCVIRCREYLVTRKLFRIRFRCRSFYFASTVFFDYIFFYIVKHRYLYFVGGTIRILSNEWLLKLWIVSFTGSVLHRVSSSASDPCVWKSWFQRQVLRVLKAIGEKGLQEYSGWSLSQFAHITRII